ncbi:MAG: phosphoribosylformylglycinamidine synthase subunit PurQ, partial [Clostridia bacterium]|nr:phosphoribosylformylglycinamidine synthase subunit PurQ [Clostridia bacterium]
LSSTPVPSARIRTPCWPCAAPISAAFTIPALPWPALLGALQAQDDLQVAAIGGKDSMSGSFESIHVPPTLVSFAISFTDIDHVVSGEFKKAGSRVCVFAPVYTKEGMPEKESMLENMDRVENLVQSGKVLSAYTVSLGGIAEAVFKMELGNGLGFRFEDGWETDELFAPRYGTFVLEMADDAPQCGRLLGTTTEEGTIIREKDVLDLQELTDRYEGTLESVFPYHPQTEGEAKKVSFTADQWAHIALPRKPRVLIPVFPGTNCEYDSARAVERAGMEADFVVVRNLYPRDIEDSIHRMTDAIRRSDMIFLPGGFSGGDEPEGSGKFILSFFRTGKVTDAVHELLHNRKGLILGICNGFQALIKLGLVPNGYIGDTDESCPTLTFNEIGRHQSMLVRTRISSNKSPFLKNLQVGEVLTVPVSHGEGRFVASPELLSELEKNGQIATQYVDLDGNPSMDIRYNPNKSVWAVEGITSLDGRIFGKMGHSERYSAGIYRNVEGRMDNGIFEGAADYFK